MKRSVVGIILFLLAFPAHALTVDLTGIWQAEDKSRHVLEITKERDHFQGQFYNLGLEQNLAWRNGNTVSRIDFAGKTVSFALDRTPGTFTGALAADGNSIAGNWLAYGSNSPLTFRRANRQSVWPIDPSPHKVRFVTVNRDIRLEVLDWGGNGPPLIFLAGLGNTAHVFDDFAPKFTGKHHVYAITRRGFGVSGAPPPTLENYDSDLLGDDVLSVMQQLDIRRPILAGHSIAGVELSSIGTRQPGKVAGLIYLEAGYGFAMFDTDSAYGVFENGDDIIRNLKLMSSGDPQDAHGAIARIQAILPHLRKGLSAYDALYAGIEPQPSVARPPEFEILDAINFGFHKYTKINPPILALFAVPQKCQPRCNTPGNKAMAAQAAHQADMFKAANPAAEVVRIPFASHRLFVSNEAEVEQRMNRFMDGLRR